MKYNSIKYDIEFQFLKNFISPVEIKIKNYLNSVIEKHLKEYPNSTGFYHKGVFYPAQIILSPQDKLKSNPLNPTYYNIMNTYLQEHKRLYEFARINKQYNAMTLTLEDNQQQFRNKIHDRIVKYIPELASIPRTAPFIFISDNIKSYFDIVISEMDHFETYILI